MIAADFLIPARSPDAPAVIHAVGRSPMATDFAQVLAQNMSFAAQAEPLSTDAVLAAVGSPFAAPELAKDELVEVGLGDTVLLVPKQASTEAASTGPAKVRPAETKSVDAKPLEPGSLDATVEETKLIDRAWPKVNADLGPASPALGPKPDHPAPSLLAETAVTLPAHAVLTGRPAVESDSAALTNEPAGTERPSATPAVLSDAKASGQALAAVTQDAAVRDGRMAGDQTSLQTIADDPSELALGQIPLATDTDRPRTRAEEITATDRTPAKGREPEGQSPTDQAKQDAMLGSQIPEEKGRTGFASAPMPRVMYSSVLDLPTSGSPSPNASAPEPLAPSSLAAASVAPTSPASASQDLPAPDMASPTVDESQSDAAPAQASRAFASPTPASPDMASPMVEKPHPGAAPAQAPRAFASPTPASPDMTAPDMVSPMVEKSQPDAAPAQAPWVIASPTPASPDMTAPDMVSPMVDKSQPDAAPAQAPRVIASPTPASPDMPAPDMASPMVEKPHPDTAPVQAPRAFASPTPVSPDMPATDMASPMVDKSQPDAAPVQAPRAFASPIPVSPDMPAPDRASPMVDKSHPDAAPAQAPRAFASPTPVSPDMPALDLASPTVVPVSTSAKGQPSDTPMFDTGLPDTATPDAPHDDAAYDTASFGTAPPDITKAATETADTAAKTDGDADSPASAESSLDRTEDGLTTIAVPQQQISLPPLVTLMQPLIAPPSGATAKASTKATETSAPGDVVGSTPRPRGTAERVTGSSGAMPLIQNLQPQAEDASGFSDGLAATGPANEGPQDRLPAPDIARQMDRSPPDAAPNDNTPDQGAPITATPLQPLPLDNRSTPPPTTSRGPDALPFDTTQSGWEAALAERITTRNTDLGQEIEITLTPDNLGTVRIKLDLSDKIASVQIVTDTPQAAQLFLQSEARLSEAFNRAGLTLTSHDASSRDPGGRDPGSRDAGNGGQRQGQNPGNPRAEAALAGLRGALTGPMQAGRAANLVNIVA
jgi:flagellar hook-length control protein FliK